MHIFDDVEEQFKKKEWNLAKQYIEKAFLHQLDIYSLTPAILSRSPTPTIPLPSNKMTLDKLAANLEAFGKKSISLASGILKGNKRS